METKLIIVLSLSGLLSCNRTQNLTYSNPNKLCWYLDFWSKNKKILKPEVFIWDVSDFYFDKSLPKYIDRIKKLKMELDSIDPKNSYSEYLLVLIKSKKYINESNEKKLNLMINYMEKQLPLGYTTDIIDLFEFIPKLVNDDKRLISIFSKRFNLVKNEDVQLELMNMISKSYNSRIFYELKNVTF